MAKIFYDVGDHPVGFVGFRVATTIGSDKDYKQMYFSLNDYSYHRADALATMLNDRWRKEAEDYKLNNKKKLSKGHGRPSTIVGGFRCKLIVDNKIRGGVKKSYLSLMFEVEGVGNYRKYRSFRPSKHGYQEAYKLAVEHFANARDLTDYETEKLLTLIPSKEVFTNYLLDKLIAKGNNFTKEDVLRLTEVI